MQIASVLVRLLTARLREWEKKGGESANLQRIDGIFKGERICRAFRNYGRA